ncbi:MAG: hypothetical protein Q4Q17_05440 [Tissierellia bacterium]|nr:hypothetical protein [Tissierellia bacterium]
MRRNIKKEMELARKAALAIIGVSVIFAVLGLWLLLKRNSLAIFPRMDIAWIGFFIVSIILGLWGVSLLIAGNKKQEWIDETDEMKSAIAAEASSLAYLVQSVLLGIGFFLLTFMGYLNKVSGFSIAAILCISNLISFFYSRHLHKNGLD